MILLKKTLEEIMEETLRELEGMNIDRDAGSVARLLLAIINKKIAGFYEALDVNMAQAFVSSAKDIFLDRIGQLLNCDRYMGESNDAYRFRITKQIQNVASANRTAVRLAALSVAGVQEIKMYPFTHGTGSYSVYVITEDPITPQSVLDEVQERIDEVQGYGINGKVFRPVIAGVEMKIRLIFKKGVDDLEKRLAISKSQDEAINYINGLNIGEPLVIDEVYKRIHHTHDEIDEIMIFSFKVNGRPKLVTNQKCAWNERFIQSDRPNAIEIM